MDSAKTDVFGDTDDDRICARCGAMLINRQARLAIRLMALMLALFGVLVWIPILIADPQAHSRWIEIVETFLITGAAWMVADVSPIAPRHHVASVEARAVTSRPS